MGSILRSYRFLNCLPCIRMVACRRTPMSNEFRCFYMPKSKRRDLHILSCHQMAQSLPKVNASPTQYLQMKSLDSAFYKIDLDVRKNSRLRMQDVEGILLNIQQMGTVSSSHALLLIRCCGSLLPDETLSCRIALTNKVWLTLTEMKSQMDVSHYNALLKVYLENEHEFQPTDFLAEMEQNGIEPNRVTFQRLVTKYCQDGDIGGASKILEFMKEKELPVNEMIFNALVVGHAKAGDMNGACEILDVMRNAKLDPTARTYSALGCGYVRAGDIQGLQQVLKDAEQNEVFLLDEDYLDIIHALATSGQSGHITEITPKLPKLMGYNQHCMHVIFKLVNEGHADVGFTLLKTMPRTSLPDGELVPAGNFFIRQLVKMDIPLDKILHYCQEMKNLNLNQKALVRAAECSLFQHKPDLALPLLKEMLKEGHPVRSHYFWPIFIALRNLGDEATYDVLKVMLEVPCPITYETYTDYVLPNLNLNDPEVIVQRIKELSEIVGSVVNPLVYHFLNNKSPSRALDLVAKFPIRLNPQFLLKSLAVAFKETGDVTSILKLLKCIIESPELSAGQVLGDYCGHLIEDYIVLDDPDETKFSQLLNGMKLMGFQISYLSLESIQGRLKYFTDCQPILETLQSMASNSIKSSPDSSITHPSEMSIEDLESHLLELKNKRMNTRGVLRRLLLAYCRTRNYDQAMKVKAEMESLNMDFTPATYSQLMDLAVVNDNVAEALWYKSLIDVTPDFVIDDFKILNLSTLLIASDRYEEAKELILGHKDKFQKRNDDEFLIWNVVQVLQAASEKGKVDQAKELFELLVVRSCHTTPSTKVVGPIVKAHLVNEDLQGALADFENYSTLYKITPCRNELCKKLIEIDDSENLQKVLDICTEIHGEANALLDLAISFIECGRDKQARKILETPGLRVRQGRLDALCERFLTLNMMKELALLVDATKRLFDVDKEGLYWYLLRGYAKENDVQKALGVWTTMQEEDIIPSNKLLIFLADFLKRNGHPIPFAVPSGAFYVAEPKGEENKKFDGLVQKGCIDEALKEKERLDQANESLGINQISILIEALVRNDRLIEASNLTEELLAKGHYPHRNIFRFLLLKLAHGGDVEGILSMFSALSPKMLNKLQFNNILAIAYMKSNRHLELLEQWENSPLTNVKESFPLGGFFGFLEEYPELEERVLKIADRFADEEKFAGPLNIVWMHYMKRERFDEANEILKRLQSHSIEKLMFRNITKYALENRNENISSQLCKAAKFLYLKQGKGALYGCHIEVLVALGKSNDAVKTFQEATEDCGLTVDNFNYNTLQKLQTALLEQGQSVPFVIPMTQRAQRNDDTSSSSSDDEK